MPAWTPDADEYAPFEEDGEVKEGIPAELATFLNKFDVTKNFGVELKRWNNEGYQGRPSIIGTFEATVPTYDAVVKMHGPGYYAFDVTWTPKGGKARSELYKVPLTGAYYTELHKKAKEEKQKQEIEEAEMSAKLDRAKGVPAGQATYADPGKMGREYMKGLVGDIKDLTDAFGMNLAGPKGAGGFGGDGTAMMFLGMMQMMMKAQENSTQLLIAVLTKNENRNPMAETISLMKEVFTMRDGIMPAEQSWIKEFVGVIAENIGPIMAMFKSPNPEDTDLYHKMDKGVSETREQAQSDPAFLKALVKHMDGKVGATMTDKILDGLLRVNRPGNGGQAPAAGAGGEKPAQAPGAGQGGGN